MRSLIENHYAWDDLAQRDRVLAHFECARIVAIEGCDVGLFKVVYGTTEVHLSQIQLLPAYHGRGIASALIRKLQNETASSGLPVTLHVLRSNRAIELYRHLGFVVDHKEEHFLFMKWSADLKQPNKTPQPITHGVTPPADAGAAPPRVMADL